MEINKLSNVATAASQARIEPSSLDKRSVGREPAPADEVETPTPSKRIESTDEADEIARRISDVVRETGLSAVNAHGFDTERVSFLLG